MKIPAATPHHTFEKRNIERDLFMTAFTGKRILAKIHKAGAEDMEPLLQAVIHRYQQLYPDYEILYLALPRDPEKRKQTLDNTKAFLDAHA